LEFNESARAAANPYFNMAKAEADLQAAIAVGDGARYAAIMAEIQRATQPQQVKAEIRPIVTPSQQTKAAWPFAAGTDTPRADVPHEELMTYPACSNWQRIGAYLIDVVAPSCFFLIPVIGIILWIAYVFGNQYVEGQTGQSLGKRATGIYLVEEYTRQPIGGWRGIGRYFLHILDGLPLGVGYIVGLCTGQTWADMIMHTRVYRKPRIIPAGIDPKAAYRPTSGSELAGWQERQAEAHQPWNWEADR